MSEVADKVKKIVVEHLGVDVLDVVNLRVSVEGTGEDPIGEQFATLAELQKEGLIRHLGISAASDAQLTEAQTIAPVVTVQNLYNLASRADDALVDRCAAENIAYAAFFPLGGFTPLQSGTLNTVAEGHGLAGQKAGRGPAPGRHAEHRGRRPRRDAPSGRPGLAAAALGHHGPHPGDLLRGPPARERRRGQPGAAARRDRHARRHRPLSATADEAVRHGGS